MKKIFGNSDLSFDSLPLKILPSLKEKFPDIKFAVKDPNEEWEMPEELVIIDTVLEIENVTLIEDLNNLTLPPGISLHDFDVASNLVYLKKLGKLKKIKIIGLPPTISETEALKQIAAAIKSISL